MYNTASRFHSVSLPAFYLFYTNIDSALLIPMHSALRRNNNGPIFPLPIIYTVLRLSHKMSRAASPIKGKKLNWNAKELCIYILLYVHTINANTCRQ